MFTDCSFTLNRIVDDCTKNSAPVTCRAGQGTVLITGFTLHFNKNINVIDNVGFGMLYRHFFSLRQTLVSKQLYRIHSRCNIITNWNICSSSEKQHKTTFWTTNLQLKEEEYHDSIYFHADMSSQECFIQYTKNQRENNETKPTFVFSGNKAGSGENRLTGLTNVNTLYASTFNQCFRKCSSSPSNKTTIEDLFNCLGIDVLNDTETISDRSTLSSCIGELLLNMTGAILYRYLPCFNKINNLNITVDQTSQYSSDNKIQLYMVNLAAKLLLLLTSQYVEHYELR